MILVTGATGFLGKNLCQHLVGQGYRVRALARPTSDTAFLEALGVSIVHGDVTDPQATRRAAAGCRYVVHAAAHFRLWGPPEPFVRVNVHGTRNVLRAALLAQVERFVHISTIIVVGPQPPGTVITEALPCHPYPTDNYARTKCKGERLALHYVRRGLPVVVLRLGALYGPHGHYGFNRLFFEEFLRNWRVQVHGGKHVIFPCYVEDAVRTIEAALTRGRVGEIYNVANPSITHREANRIIGRLSGRGEWRINFPGWMMLAFAYFLEALAKVTGREPFYPANLAPYVFRDWLVDSSKAERELGLVSTPFEEGARRTLEWYRLIGFW
ncbi:MAG: NAD-dependent epimerase/dehydratase family protein [Chloroflexi bacterium]|nr:MAG: NAD-dependent epimerase/dehydratase family protein [Chloroflexota bacterium]